MRISQVFENIRKREGQHKILAFLLIRVLSLIGLAGFWILIKYGVDDDRYFWLGIFMAIVSGLAMLPLILPRK